MTTLYLCRHGDYSNPDQIQPFRYPHIILSAKGEEQIEHNAQYFKDKHISVIYTSPVARTVETAHIFSQALAIPYVENNRLIEVESPYQGIASSEYDRRVNDLYTNEGHIKGGGETVEEVYRRMKNVIREIKAKHTNENVIVVSHGDPIMIFSLFERGATYFHTSLFQFYKYIPKGGILKHEYDSKGQFASFEEVNY